MYFPNRKAMTEALQGVMETGPEGVKVLDESALRRRIYELVYTGTFHPDPKVAQEARTLVRQAAWALGIYPASIHEFYMGRGRGEYGGFTVPAMNLRGLTFDVARRVFRVAKALNAGAFIFEIARSEIGYTRQSPAEYATAVLGAAIAEGYRGPVFIQGDHFQINRQRFTQDPEGEREALRKLILEALSAGFYNIDVDASTMVDLSQPTTYEQQRPNFELTAEFTAFIREHEPEGITVSVGGEIGEIGGKNSTPEELRAFMNGLNEELRKRGDLPGISKISVQTGTTHGGVVLPDGTIARVKLDFETLRVLSEIARKEYGLAGAVQHGASTLPEEAFDKFPEVETAEIHLATGFQNIIYDHPALPEEFRQEIYRWLKTELKGEWKEGWTEEQFLYKTRKKGFGPFKKAWWDLPEEVKGPIMDTLQERFHLLFTKLRVADTYEMVVAKTPPVTVKTPLEV